MKSPSNLKKVGAVLWLVGFYKKYMPGFGKSSEPLYQLLKKDRRFSWTKECEDALQRLKWKFILAPSLVIQKTEISSPQPEKHPWLALVHFLAKNKKESLELLHMPPRLWLKVTRTILQQNLSFLLWFGFSNQFKTYLLRRKFVIVTDRRPLVWLYSFEDLECMIPRLFEKLEHFIFEARHNARKDMP